MRRISPFQVGTICWIAMVCLLPGCSKQQPEFVPVSGRITMLGKPVAEVIVNFAPIGNTPGSGAMGATDANGQFELTDARGSKGARSGQYKIHLYPAPIVKTDGAQTDVVSLGGGDVPSIYIDPNRTPLVADVPSSGGHVEVMLTRNGENTKTNTNPLPK